MPAEVEPETASQRAALRAGSEPHEGRERRRGAWRREEEDRAGDTKSVPTENRDDAGSAPPPVVDKRSIFQQTLGFVLHTPIPLNAKVGAMKLIGVEFSRDRYFLTKKYTVNASFVVDNPETGDWELRYSFVFLDSGGRPIPPKCEERLSLDTDRHKYDVGCPLLEAPLASVQSVTLEFEAIPKEP